jgi:hypothetical protein
MRAACSWTDGEWKLGPGCVRGWNEVQNTSQDVRLLGNFLVREYKARIWTTQSAENCPGAKTVQSPLNCRRREPIITT